LGHPSSYWLDMIGFGIAGFDPTIPLVALGWFLVGMRRRTVAIFVATALLGTWIYGVALSLTVARLDVIRSAGEHLRAGPSRVVLETVVLAAGVGWLVARWRRGPAVARPVEPRATTVGVVLLAVVLVLGWAADPGFLGGVVVAGQHHGAVAVLAGQALWVACALWPVGIVVLGLAGGFPDQLALRFRTWWDRIAPERFWALNALLVLGMLAVAADGLGYLTGGRYLVLARG
jgi:hypothetical protein